MTRMGVRMRAADAWRQRADARRRVHEVITRLARKRWSLGETPGIFRRPRALRKLMHTAAQVYGDPVVSPVADDVELIGDAELGDGDVAAVENPSSQLDP